LRTPIAVIIALVLLATTAYADAVSDGEACRVANEYGEFDKAIDLCNRALAEGGLADDQRAVALTNRAFAYRAKRDDVSALRDLDDAIRLWPDYLIAHWARAFERVAAGNYVGAVDEYDSVAPGKVPGVPKFFTESEFYAARGNAYFLEGDLDRAIGDYSRAISLKTTPTPYRERGIAYFLKGDRHRAATDFAVDLDMYVVARWPSPPDSILWQANVDLEGRSDPAGTIKRSIGNFDLDQWPGPIIRYYQNSFTKDDVRKAALADDARVAQARDCQAAFYFGILARLTGQGDGTADLEHASDICPKPAIEGAAARILLRRK
jgi:lipoprotein NlpI